MDQKELLLQKGFELFSTQSYNSIGLRAIAKSIDVPIGSFHYHFKNKEAFALAIIDRFFEKELLGKGSRIIFDLSTNAKQKLVKYFQVFIDFHKQNSTSFDTTSSCLLAGFGQELSNQNQVIADKVASIYNKIILGIKTLLDLGKVDGSVKRDINTKQMAGFIFDAYEGALLRRKIKRSDQPLDDFIKQIDTII